MPRDLVGWTSSSSSALALREPNVEATLLSLYSVEVAINKATRVSQHGVFFVLRDPLVETSSASSPRPLREWIETIRLGVVC